MSATLYLAVHTLKNSLKNMVKKPAALIAYIAIFGVMIMSMRAVDPADIPDKQNLDVFAAFVVAIFMLIFMLTASQGLKQGTTLFRMADVNFMFTSPIKPSSVLVYGILRQTGILVIASVCMLMQYPNVRMNFGLDGNAVAGLMIAYVLAGIFSNLFSANIYAACAKRAALRRTADICVKAAAVLVAIGFVYTAVVSGNIVYALRSFFGSDAWNWVPIIGWSRAVTMYAAVGEWSTALIYIALLALACGGMMLWLKRSDADFFEDVLVSAESMQARKEAAGSGRLFSTGDASKSAKRELPKLKGRGASAFFYRSLREQQRKSRWIFSLTTIGAVIAPCVGYLMFSSDGPDELGLFPILYVAAYALIFLSMTSSVARELTHPYLFTAPVSPFKKLVAICVPQFMKFAADTVVFFAVTMIVLKPGITEALLAAGAYLTLGAVFTTGILLIEKLLGGMKNKVLIVLLYMLILILLLLPGFVAAAIVSGFNLYLAYGVCIVWNALGAALIVLICRNLLNSMET